MKQYGFRLWFANALIVVSALVLVVFLLEQVLPGFQEAASWLIPILVLLVCVSALVFAAFEAIFIYRNWKKETVVQPSIEEFLPVNEKPIQLDTASVEDTPDTVS